MTSTGGKTSAQTAGRLPVGGPLVVAGVSWWNRSAVAGLLAEADARPVMLAAVNSAAVEAASRGQRTLVAWASKTTPDIVAACRDRDVPLVRIEDGFLRSIGLGAGLVAGASYALDGRGIYYDARTSSDLEHQLEHAELAPADVARGLRIREEVVLRRLSKYNLAGAAVVLPERDGRERILVPGQVAADAAIRTTISATVDLQASNVNLELLSAVRRRNPRALIVYKPHPDVAKGLRPGAVTAEEMRGVADVVADGVDILSLIEAVDRVETLSSLAGFEALLRGRAVTVHGVPFYAGWGLTEDLTPAPRRSRRRSVDELVEIALTRYCRYVDPETYRPIGCEELIGRLATLSGRPGQRLIAEVRTQLSWLGRRLGL